MLRIVPLEHLDQVVTLQVEGTVIAPWVDELGKACERALASGTVVALDLSAVSFVGREGVRLIRTLVDRGVQVKNCSPFVKAQLDGWHGGPPDDSRL